MKICLAGNPNSGKTTLFNELTKLNQKIGNWPGVTVEKKQGCYFKDKNIEIIDLPGVYSLNPISQDEKIADNFLRNEKPDLVINVVDSTNLERSLGLTLQLLETNIPVVIALNMEDELGLHGVSLNIEAVKKELGVPAILVSARKKRNIDALMETAAATAGNERQPFISEGKTEEQRARFRHDFIKSKIELFRTKSDSKAKTTTERIDKVLLNKWLAFPIFAAVIWLMYFISIQVVGEYGTRGMEWLFFDVIGENLEGWLEKIGAAQWVISLFVGGIIKGVGTVLSFVPQILMLFVFITFLEAVGYMSRIAVIMDRLFKKLGLSGKSFIPMIIGTGCSVPAIMSTKTIENPAERRAAIMLTPFIPCSVKMPVFALIAGALFPGSSFVAPSMYFLGIFMVIIGGLILKAFRKDKTGTESFFIELPHYRWPQFKNMTMEIWNKVKDFIVRAGTVILVASVVLWFLSNFNFAFQMVDIDDSIISFAGSAFWWLFTPLGFGTTAAVVAVIAGVMAKELVIAVFAVLLVGTSGGDLSTELARIFTPHAAYAFMAFLLLSSPCIAAIAAAKRELGSTRWMFISIGFQCAVAYVVALIINQSGNLWVYDRTLCISLIAGGIVAVVVALCVWHMIKSKKKHPSCSGNCNGCPKKSSCS